VYIVLDFGLVFDLVVKEWRMPGYRSVKRYEFLEKLAKMGIMNTACSLDHD